MNEQQLLSRITSEREIFDGKPIIRGRRLAVEYVLGVLAAGDTDETLLAEYPWLEREDIQACLLYAQKLVGQVKPQLSVADLKHEIPQILKQAPYLTLLVLFGSRARGDTTADSDWDFAFLCDEDQRQKVEKKGWDAFRIWTILQKSFDLLDDQIDVVEMKNCSALLAHNIAQDGQVIYESSPGTFEAYQQKKLKSPTELKAMSQKTQADIDRKLQALRK